MTESVLTTGSKVGPYMGVTHDKKRTFDNGRTLRLLIYGAYNAFGLIGSECNGIAILDEDYLEVIADEIGKQSSGYFGPSAEQIALYNQMLVSNWDQFVEQVQAAPEHRIRHENWTSWEGKSETRSHSPDPDKMGVK